MSLHSISFFNSIRVAFPPSEIMANDPPVVGLPRSLKVEIHQMSIVLVERDDDYVSDTGEAYSRATFHLADMPECSFRQDGGQKCAGGLRYLSARRVPGVRGNAQTRAYRRKKGREQQIREKKARAVSPPFTSSFCDPWPVPIHARAGKRKRC